MLISLLWHAILTYNILQFPITPQIQIGKKLRIRQGLFVVDDQAKEGELVFTEFIRPVCLPCVSMCGSKRGSSELMHGVKMTTYKAAQCQTFSEFKIVTWPSISSPLYNLLYYAAH